MTLIPSPVRRGFDAILDPIARSLIAAKVNPNTLTTFGTLILVAGGWCYGSGYIRSGGALLLLSGVFDMLDGKVARFGEGMTRFGAFYDSTLDRVGEAALFTGLAVLCIDGGVPAVPLVTSLVICMITLGATATVSYARARAEGLGLDCSVGLAQRAERILVLGIPTVLFGAGPNGWLLLGIVSLLGLTSIITVIQRIVHVHGLTRGDVVGVEIPELAGKGQGGR